MKIWISIVLLTLLAVPCPGFAADGKVCFGYYFDQNNLRSRPDGGLASFRSEVEIGQSLPCLTGKIRPYVNLVTLMDAYNDDGSFHPASIRYTLGIGWEKQLSRRIHFFTSLQHFCWHPVDAEGTVESTNYIEFGFRF